MWVWFLRSRFGQTVALVAVFILAMLGIITQQRHRAAKAALERVREKDRENAEAIRDRVERDADGKLHDYDGSGWRD